MEDMGNWYIPDIAREWSIQFSFSKTLKNCTEKSEQMR